MGKRRKTRNMRKLLRIGGTSTAVTIPVHIIRDLGWREDQYVVVKKYGKDKLLIEDWKPEKGK